MPLTTTLAAELSGPTPLGEGWAGARGDKAEGRGGRGGAGRLESPAMNQVDETDVQPALIEDADDFSDGMSGEGGSRRRKEGGSS